MSKEKIRKVVTNNQNKLLAIFVMLIAILIIIGVNVNANKNDDYVVEIKDDGSLNIAEDANSSITKKIVEETPRSLTYEVQVKNLAPATRIPEVAIVIDSSRSMGINDLESSAKQKAIQLVTELKTHSPRTKISISSNGGVKNAMNTAAVGTYTNVINDISYADGQSVAKAIDYAAGTFSGVDTDKYLIIFSDATDSTKDKLELLTNNGIEIYSMLTEITNSEYETSTLMGTVHMLSTIEDFSEIYHKTNKSLVNVEITDVFSNEASQYFDFSIISKENDVEIEETSNGYILKCNAIKVGETRTLKYTLTINEDAKIDTGRTYKELNSSDNIDVKYEDYELKEQKYQMENSPTFVICRKYSLTIKAVSEKSNDLPIENMQVKVVGTTVLEEKDILGNDIVKTIFDDTLTTDSKGRILIDDLKTLGDITFEIKPIVNQFGYVETSATQIIVHNDPEGVGTIWAESDVTQPDVDVVNRNITVLLPISVQTYDMEVETVNLVDDKIKLGNIEYRLIQPKLNSKFEMEALYGTTDANGKLVFKPAVMTKDGSYQYILTQMNEQEGYDPMGNVTLIVTFENGKVTKIAKQYNERVTAEKINDAKTKVTVGNAPLLEDTFFFELNLKDELSGKGLFGGMYDIAVTRVTSAGDQVTNSLNGYMTDNDGKINIEIPGTGYITLKITETSPKAGYVADTVLKEVTFFRKNGTVQYISSKNPMTIDAVADSDNNKVIVNLKSKVASEQNRIQVHLIDQNEPGVNVKGALLAAKKVGSNDLIYATTDRNGIANFIVSDEVRGSYQYEISLLGAAPSGYLKPATDQLAIITAQFDNNRHIVSTSEVSHTTPTINVGFKQMKEEDFIYDTAQVELSLAPDPAYAYSFKINLLDGTHNKPLAGGKYSILMETYNESTKEYDEVKYLSGKFTDANGNYTTRIVGDGKTVRITVTETETVKGYILTTTSQIIELERTATGYIIASSSPNVYDPANGQKIGTELSGKVIIYHDVNICKTGANTILNLHMNKMDTNDFLVAGVKVKLSSETLLRADGKKLDDMHDVLDTNGNVIGQQDYYVTDQNGYLETLGIKVKGDKLNNGERIDYLDINEVDNNGNIIPNTDIKLKLTFRLNKETNVVEITNVEATWGNRLVKEKTYSSRETSVAYESDVYLDLYTNFDDVGNFSLDLKKVNKDGGVLPGAKYDVIVIRPDSTTLVRRDINVNDSVELEGILVSQGTTIEITEKTAPIGYNINKYTEIITITEVNPITGIVKCELEPSSYSTPRAKISNTQPIVSSDGRYKLCVTLDLVDYEMDTFKLGIKAQDATTVATPNILPIEGYTFKVSTSEGAQRNTPATNKEGKTNVQVGANYKIDKHEVTYTIDTLKVANYYKKLTTPIEVKVVFDLNGNIISNLTDSANQTQPGYKTIWNIEATNTIGGNDIDIVINIQPCDPLVVNVETIDTINKTKLTNVEYQITPTINLQGTGTTQLQSGYVLPDGMQTYTIKQTNAASIQNYEQIPEQQIKVVYDADGNVQSVEELTGEIHKVSISGKQIKVSIDIEPSVPFTIKNIAYFGGTPIAGSKYEISLSDNYNKTFTTDSNGEDIKYIGKLGTNSSAIYKVKQTQAAHGYATVEDFEIEVHFDEQRNITGANLVNNDVNEYVNFVEVTHKQPSTTTDKGYNGNNKGIVNIVIKSYPNVEFNIENVDRSDNTVKLQGTTYKIESSIHTKADKVTTDINGIAIANLDRSGFNTTVTYTITELSPSSRYQTLAIDAVIEVDFDENGFIIDQRIIKRADVVEVQIPTQSTDLDKFKLNITIKNNPELKIAITKVDKDDPTILIPRVDFELTARIVKDNLSNYDEDEVKKLTLNTSTLTEEDYLSQVIDRLKIVKEDIEDLKETMVIETLIAELKNNNNLTEAEETEINDQTNNKRKINKIVELGKATKIQVNQRIKDITNKNIIDRLIEDEKTTQDRVNDLLNIVKNEVRLDVDNITTNTNGYAVAYMDKTLAGKTIEYTLRETKKATGYDWLDEVVIFEITYDAEGKMVAEDPVDVKSGEIEITNINQNKFEIAATVKNKPSQEVFIHLSVEDVYDSDKKLETATFDAYLISDHTTINDSYVPDNKYRVTLQTGSTTAGTGLTTAHGEDSETIGIYEETPGTRTLRLVQKSTPTSYYIGTNKYDSAYQSIAYAMLVDVTFGEEGKVIGTKLHNPGSDTHQIGYVADGRYIQVSNTSNTINITVKYYPMLQVQMQTIDMYTKQSLNGSYTIDTRVWGTTGYHETYRIQSGYINPHTSLYRGNTYSAGYTTDASIAKVDNARRVAIGPTEAEQNDSKERTLYIYENAEPTNPIQYQTYLPRRLNHSVDYLLATIKVKYDDLGQVNTVEVIQTNSSNNIKSGFFTTVKATVNEHTIQVVVEYAPITTITAKVIDEVSGVGLSGIRINPYLGGTNVTSTSYEHRTYLYYTTGNSGSVGWTYWGASVPKALNRYILDTYTVYSGYEGYFDPGNIILDVTYDDKGRITAVEPKSTDSFGDVNAVDVSWSNNNISITIKYSRKFNVQLYKVDYNDSSKKLNAVFNIQSSNGLNKEIAANTVTTLGKVYPGKIVKYTLSETTVPGGYIPIENLDVMVEFNNNGSIRNATSTSPYYQFVKSAPVDSKTNSLRKTDLIANIKNKPRFDVSIQLSDKFYPTLKLQGGTFTIENSKGDISSGGVQTDANGILETYVGTVYPNEDVIYTVKQTNTIPGYYGNPTIVRFKVHFNANGKIESYSLIDGTDVATMNPTSHIGKQSVRLNVTNKPKDIKIGINKYDGLDKEAMQDIQFTLKTEETGKRATTKTVVTNADGTATDVVDTFVEKTTNRVATYTISEIKAATSYRKIQDVVVQVTYKPDGSIYLYDVLSNPSNVGVQVATDKIRYAGNTPVHILLDIPNDNAYDLIVKNEDINYAGLGVVGTEYDVSINGVNKGPITTNNNGIATVKNQTQTGNITIVVTERKIGEGYREDNNNTATIQIEKGVTEYSLKFVDNSNPTNATVNVDETFGTVTVTFKNETKLELTVQKEDINTKQVLEGVVFDIVESELDSNGIVKTGTERTITTNDTNTTDINGLLHFDLGLSKQNTTMQYVFTEVTPPTGYTQIFPITVTVKFDAYGNIIQMTDNSRRAQEVLATNTGRSHHMMVVIGNGTMNEDYTIKIVTEDSVSGNRINGSIFQVKAIEEKTNSVNRSITGATKNISSTIVGNLHVLETGALKLSGVTAEGEVSIDFRQIECATGYIYDSNQTSGVVKINAEFQLINNETEKEVTLSVVDSAGFDVSVDNINKEVKIKILNEPRTTFEITKVDADTKSKMQNVKFNVTSAILDKGVLTPTNFSEDAKVTNANGYTEASAGTPFAGKTVIYTISEQKVQDYDQLKDIILSVQYDTNGNIAEYKILSSPDDITIKADSEKEIRKRVMKNTDEIGVVDIEYSNIKIPTGTGSRILQMEINNHKTVLPRDFQIEIGKYHEDTTYPYLIPGAKYEITVTQEHGKAVTTWTDITDENGIILSPYFDGYGEIEIAIKEIASPDGYKLDGITRRTRLIKYENSQRIVVQSTDSGATINDDFTKVYLKAVDEVVGGLYDIVISKVDAKNGALIAGNPAGIKLEMIEEHETITQEVNSETGEIIENKEISSVRVPILEEETDENGRIIGSKLKTPTAPGDYTYILSETKAPQGYKGIEESEVEIVVTFEENQDQDLIITNVAVKNAQDVKASRSSNKVMNIIVYNQDESYNDVTLADDEFAIDLRKVDEELYQITTTTAEFILTDLSTNQETKITTDELGRAEVLKLKMPKEAGNYKYKLKEIKAPKGYKLVEEDMYLLMEFREDQEGKIYLNAVSTEGKNLVHANKSEQGELPNRKLQLKVINNHIPYTVVIEKHHESDPYYPYHIQGVEFDIKVTQEYGEKTIEWTDTTNAKGIIEREGLEGYGYIKIEITEKSAPSKYKANYKTLHLEIYRDKGSKGLKEIDSTVHYQLDEDNQRIVLMPVNQLADGIYDIVINKIDKITNTTIIDNPAEFNLYMIKKYYTQNTTDSDPVLTELRVPIIQNEKTDNLGMLVKDSINMPDEEGVYTFELEEAQAPNGYEGLKQAVRFEVTLSLNDVNELVITDVKVLNETENVKVLAFKDQLINLAVANSNGIPEGSIAIDVTKVDNNGQPITSDTAVFRVTDSQTGEVLNYIETTKQTGNGYAYINKPTSAGEYTYVLNEIKAPDGYALDRQDITLKLKYEQNNEGAIYISKADVQGDNVIYEQPSEGEIVGNRVSISVKNEVGQTGGANDKPYTIVINKVDSVTGERIQERTEFDISLVNGEIVHAATNEQGQIIIENVYMPSSPGKNEIGIKEIKAPEGYELDSEIKLVNVTFTGIGKNMIISNIELGQTNNKNIEIVTAECTEDKIVLNVLNEGNEKLYVISKKYNKDYKFYDEALKECNDKSPMYDDGEDVYEILDYFYGVYADKGSKKGKPLTPLAYTIDKPFIDTKIAKANYKNVSVEEFIGNLESNGHMVVLDQNENELGPKDLVATGMILKSTLGNQKLTFDIVVKGDGYMAPNEKKPGRVTTADKNALTNIIAGNTTYVTNPLQLRALDIDMDGRLNTSDKAEITQVLNYLPGDEPYYKTWSNSNTLSDKKHIQYVKKEDYIPQ